MRVAFLFSSVLQLFCKCSAGMSERLPNFVKNLWQFPPSPPTGARIINSPFELRSNFKRQYTLFCLATNTTESEHTSTGNTAIAMIEERGILNLSGQDISFKGFFPLPASVIMYLMQHEI